MNINSSAANARQRLLEIEAFERNGWPDSEAAPDAARDANRASESAANYAVSKAEANTYAQKLWAERSGQFVAIVEFLDDNDEYYYKGYSGENKEKAVAQATKACVFGGTIVDIITLDQPALFIGDDTEILPEFNIFQSH